VGKGSGIKRVGMLFAGGPAPAANAVISAAALSFINSGIEVIGFYDGYDALEDYSSEHPLVEGCNFIRLTRDHVSAIRNRKDIILRTSRANPSMPVRDVADAQDEVLNTRLRASYAAFERYEIDALVSIGGDDTLKRANCLVQLQEQEPGLRPVRIVHLPKTIDNDYFGIDWTFGFFSAADSAAAAIRNLGADARSTQVWYVLELMGRKAGWLTYAAGIAGEATRMLSVEDYDGVFDVRAEAERMVDLMLKREEDGRNYGIICIAEGLADRLPDELRPKADDGHGNLRLGEAQVGKTLAREMASVYEARTGRHIRVRSKQVGYEVRCAEPGAFDVLLGTQLGVGAYRALVEEGLTGVMVSVEDQLSLKYVPFSTLIDPETMRTKIRFIDRDSDFYKLARALEYQGILSGDADGTGQ